MQQSERAATGAGLAGDAAPDFTSDAAAGSRAGEVGLGKPRSGFSWQPGKLASPSAARAASPAASSERAAPGRFTTTSPREPG